MKYIVIFYSIVLCSFLLLGCQRPDSGLWQESQTAAESEEIAETQTDGVVEETASSEKLDEEVCFVYVCGAVVRPGVYEMEPGSRIYQAIEKAGGLTEDAGDDSVNQADLVSDGQMIKVLTKEESLNSIQNPVSEKTLDDRVNLNTAGAEQLMTLPGIGMSKADSILSYRETNGGFRSIEEIKNIAGIKDGVYAKIKDRITVD